MRPMYLLLGSFVSFHKIISYSFEYLYMHLTKCCDFFKAKNYVLVPNVCMAYSGTSLGRLDRKNQTKVELWDRDR